MRERTSVVRVVILTALVALVAAACGIDTGQQTDGEEPSTTGSPTGTDAAAGGGRLDTYRLGIFEDVTTENLWDYNDTEGGTVWNQYLLATTSAAAYTIAMPGIEYVPDLAAGELEPASREGRSWIGTITLRDDIVWSDGEPITADDFAFTWQTVIDVELQGGWLDFADPDVVTAVEALDERTIQFTFNREPGLAIWGPGTNVTSMPVQPEHFWASVVEEALASDDPRLTLLAASATEAPAAGATVFTDREEGSFASTAANESWYGTGEERMSGGVSWTEGPYADAFQFSVYGSQEAAVLALADGEVDLLLNPLGMQRGFQEQVEGNPELTAIVNPTNGYRYLAFNHSRAPMSDAAFRDALTALINKEFVTESLLQGVAFPLYVILPEGNVAWYNEEVAAELAEVGYAGLDDNTRRQTAIDILTEAGYSWESAPEIAEDGTFTAGSGLIDPNGERVPQLELISPTAAYDPLRATFGNYISGVAQEMGIPIVNIPTDFNKIVEDVFALEDNNYTSPFDMYILGYSLGNPAFPTFHCSFFCSPPRGNSNNLQYSSEEFDALAAEFDAATTEEEAFEAMWEMERLIARDKPHVPLFDTGILEFYSNRVTYPFTETLHGLQFLSGMQSSASAK